MQEYVRVLLHLQQFCFEDKCGTLHMVLGPPHVWVAHAEEDSDVEDAVGDDGDVSVLCCTKFNPEKLSMCDKC